MNKRTIILVLTSLLAAATVIWLQGKFEHADEKNAINIAKTYRSKAGTSIPDVLQARHPRKVVQWSSKMQSACFQHIEVDASVFDDGKAEPNVYRFMIDLNGPGIHPANSAARELLTSLDKPPTTLAPASSSVPSSVPASAPALPSGAPTL